MVSRDAESVPPSCRFIDAQVSPLYRGFCQVRAVKSENPCGQSMSGRLKCTVRRHKGNTVSL